MESWSQLFLSCKEGSTFEFSNKQLEKSALQWVSVLLAFAGQEQGRELLGLSILYMLELTVLTLSPFQQVLQDTPKAKSHPNAWCSHDSVYSLWVCTRNIPRVNYVEIKIYIYICSKLCFLRHYLTLEKKNCIDIVGTV